MTRPSKSFLFDLLERTLRPYTSGIGLDCASANFKNRWMFKTSRYYGLDNNISLIEQGMKKYDDEGTFGIHADIVHLEALPHNSVDVLVSTNTFAHIPQQKISPAIKTLCRLVTPEGVFFCHVVAENEMKEWKKIVMNEFSDVRVFYLKNFISKAYENIFERNGELGYHPIASKKFMRLFAWLLSRLEYFTSRFRFGNEQVVFIARGRKVDKKDFDISSLPQKKSRLYSIYSK